MKNVVKKIIVKKNIPDYILEIISMNYDKCFLDLTAIERGEEVTLVHDITGFTSLKEADITLFNALNIIKTIVIYAEINENHLIFSDEYLINIENIYLNTDNKEVVTKIMYCPDEDQSNFLFKLTELISDIAELFEYSDKALILSFLENIEENQQDINKIKAELDVLCENVLI